MRILIVEDDVVLGMVAAAALEEQGHGVAGPVFNVAEALALVAGSEPRPELALVDINLGGHDEGIGLAHRLRDDSGIPSIFVSGQLGAARDHRDAALGLLTKPYDIDDLVAVVAAVPALAAGERPSGLPPGFEVFPFRGIEGEAQ